MQDTKTEAFEWEKFRKAKENTFATNPNMDVQEKIERRIYDHHQIKHNSPSVILISKELLKELIAINVFCNYVSDDTKNIKYMGLEVIEAKIEGIKVY